MTVERWSQNLSLSKEGLWISPRVSAVSYPEEGNEDYFQIEEKSFWFQHRNQCLGKVMKRYPPEGLLFDIGGGNGFVSKGLEGKWAFQPCWWNQDCGAAKTAKSAAFRGWFVQPFKTPVSPTIPYQPSDSSTSWNISRTTGLF